MYLQKVQKSTLSPFDENCRYVIEIQTTPLN